MSSQTPPLEQAVTALQERLQEVISADYFRKREVIPERRRVLGVIHDALGELRRLHMLRRDGLSSSDAQALDRTLSELVSGRQITSLNIPAAWEYALDLQRLLLSVGDSNYIKAQLESEWRAETAADEPYAGRWSAFFDRELLEDLRAAYQQPGGVQEGSDTHRQAVEYLTHLSLTRNGKGRVLAMNADTRKLYLDRLTKALAGLLALLLAIIYIASNNANYSFVDVLQEAWKEGAGDYSRFRFNFGSAAFHQSLLAAAFGAMGSLLSGFYTLRDKSRHLNDLRAFRSAMWAQPFVGATAGVVVGLIVRSGLIGLSVRDDVEQWSAYALYGFLAGFSEPFFLGLVSRVASTVDKDAGAGGAAPPVQPPPPGGGARQPAPPPPPLTSPPSSPPDEDFHTSPP